MKFITVFVYIIMVVRTREAADSNTYQSDILWNYQLDEDDMNMIHRTRRTVAVPIESEADRLKRTTGINLPPDYNKFKLPKPADSPMSVFVFINITKVLDWDELNGFVVLDMRFRVMWTDFRILEFNNNTHIGNGRPMIESMSPDDIQRMRKVNNDPDMLSLVWKPNLFIDGLLEVRQPILMTKPVKVRYIAEHGWFEYITRIQIKVDCPMDFQYYPADTQVCSIPIRSYTYLKSHMNLSWYKRGVDLTNLEVSSFAVRVDDVSHYYLQKSEDPNEVHEVLGFSLYGRRRLSYHLIQTYLASSFYIIITTLCFLLPSTMIEARIGMSMTTLLTLTAMFASVRESTPIVSYTKAIDIWMVGCIFFVFLTLLQFTFSTWLKHAKNETLKSRRIGNGKKNEAFEMDSKPQSSEETEIDTIEKDFSTESLAKYEKVSNFLEAYSFPLFLAIFVVYSALYWIWLLSASNYYNSWNVNPTWNRI